jgi:hypothetical protein
VLNCQATGVRATNGILISGYAPVDQNGNLTVYPQQTTTYTCLAINTIGQEATKMLTVTVNSPTPPPTSTAPVINLPLVVDSFNTSYTIDLTGTTSPTGAYPITYLTASLGSLTIVNPTSATPTVIMPALVGPNDVQITATDAKGQTTTFILTIYYVGPAAGDKM